MAKKSNTTKESYKPSEALGNYLNEKLRLSKKERELVTAGEDLSSDDKRTKRNNDRMKVYILNKHIFQAMRNLTFFFEFIGQTKNYIIYLKMILKNYLV